MNQKNNLKKFKVKRSSAGLGLFATESIAKGDFVIEYTGEKITHSVANERRGKYLFTLNSRYVIDGRGRENLARYINHSCKPNCEAVIDKGRAKINAVRDI
ncbi:MAG: SET domain-containing protein [Candidatus Moranbacteria bacterium GW2011_GWC2_45_10]|nr:MAG: SET domain-containing protein [Candidatus Moranbacteria bacterium GW2011_GWC2_45_10]